VVGRGTLIARPRYRGRWAFALCFVAITILSVRYLFIIPIAFSIVITVCLTAAAWLSARQVSAPPLP